MKKKFQKILDCDPQTAFQLENHDIIDMRPAPTFEFDMPVQEESRGE